MGNLIAVGAHCARGEEVILGQISHVYKYEAGGASALLGVTYATVRHGVDFDIIMTHHYHLGPFSSRLCQLKYAPHAPCHTLSRNA